MPVISTFLCTMHKAGRCIGTAQHDIIAGKILSFQVKDTQWMSYLISLTWVFSFIKLVITSIAELLWGLN